MIRAVTAVVVILYLINYFSRKKFPVNSTGVILITGASTGIGRHAAETIAKNHNFLVLAGVRKEKDAEEIRNMKIGNLQPINVDVTSHESCANAVQEIHTILEDRKLKFVALVNNAGISRTLPIKLHDLSGAKSIFDTNFFGAVDLTKQLLPKLREAKGRVIMMSSIAGFVAAPSLGFYCASKFALEAVSDALRREVAHFGVSVSVVEPAFVKSAIHERSTEASIGLARNSDEERFALYNNFYGEDTKEKILAQIAAANDPSVTTSAIEHALVADYPRTRYVVASAAGLPASLLRWFEWMLSDRLDDIVLAMSY